MIPLRSRVTTIGRQAAGARALWRATGTGENEFGKPIVAIVNSYTQFVPGHVHLKEVGDIVDASARSVARWTSGQVVPQRLNKQRLIELAYVADALAEVLPRDQANVWMFSPNRLLAHAKPADLVRDGEYQRVLALIDAMAEGIFV